MDFWTLYLLSRLNAVGTMFEIGLFVLGLCAIGSLFGYCISNAKTEPEIKRSMKLILLPSAPLFFICILGAIATPSFNQALTFIGVDYVTHNKRVAENVDKTLQVFESIVEEKLKTISEVTE